MSSEAMQACVALLADYVAVLEAMIRSLVDSFCALVSGTLIIKVQEL